jgi:tetratricopeptide (TPR) repeat protein
MRKSDLKAIWRMHEDSSSPSIRGLMWGNLFQSPPASREREIMAGMRFPTRLGVLAAIFAACSFLAAQTTTEQVGAITSALRVGQFDKALQLLQPELQQSPKNPQLWTLRGIAFSGKGDKREALGAFRHALENSPDYLPALEGAAQIEYENGAKDAVALLQHVLQLRPNDPTSHAMLAALAYRHGDCATAVPHFEQSGSLAESQVGALQEYGDCLVRMKETEKAIQVFSRALAQSNSDASIRYRLASLQFMTQHSKDAIATLQPLLQENSTDANVLDLAASAYEADGNTPEAVRLLREAILSDPHNVNLYLDFANVSIDHQSFSVGVDMIDAGLRAEPKAAALYVARGVLYVQLAQYDKAEADFETADALDPWQSMGSAAEGLAAVQANEPERALATVRSKLITKPNDPFLLYLQADILTQRGPDPASLEFREALASAKKAVSLRPSLAAAHDVLAKLYLQAGQNEFAIAQCRKALTSDPKDQTALYHLIQALRKTRQTDEIPDLLKRLADLRMEGTKEEAAHNRYKLVEEKAPSSFSGQQDKQGTQEKQEKPRP